MKKILIFIIKIYQYFVSPFLGNRCRFLPSCSEYFVEALKTQGLTIGIKLGVKRVFIGQTHATGLAYGVSQQTLARSQMLSHTHFVSRL